MSKAMSVNDLRQWQHDNRVNARVRKLAGDAADKIEALEAENVKLRAALDAIVVDEVGKIALAALSAAQ